MIKMKNRRKIMKCMKENVTQPKFSVDNLIRGTNLKKSQIDYEIKLMIEQEIVTKITDMKDLRRSYYVKGSKFDDEWRNF